jgi:monoamine oxidase
VAHQQPSEVAQPREGAHYLPTLCVALTDLQTAEVWNRYMDGAVRSGERAAHEVLTA